MRSLLCCLVSLPAGIHATQFMSRSWPSDIIDSIRGTTPAPPVRERLRNHFDVQYTAHVNVGGQRLSTVLDTGSFELLVFSEHCTMCGATHGLYDDAKSNTFRYLGFVGEHSFGSGTTRSNEAFEYVKIAGGNLEIERQHFWEVVDADMAILQDDFFHAILGIGPPKSAEKFATMNADQIHDEFERYKASHNGEAPEAMIQEVQHYDDAVVHSKNATSVTQSLKVRDVSICLGREPASDGVFVWNDDAAQKESQKFRTVSVIGDIYWSAKLKNVRLGRVGVGSGAKMGCGVGECSAVLDTGTSLIVAPQEAIQKVQDLLDNWIDPTGDCSDLSGLPDLEFEMDGVLFSLPPDAYVGRVDADSAANLHSMPHWHAKSQKKKRGAPSCVPLLMASDTDTQFGQLWILGMPFFRKYYTTFHFDHRGRGAKSVSFAVADARCTLADEVAELREQPAPTKINPLTLNASRIRAPHWVPTAQAMKSPPTKNSQAYLNLGHKKTRPFVHI